MVMLPQETLNEIMDTLHTLMERQQSAPTSAPNDWLTSEEVRQILDISTRTWQKYRDSRVIPYVQHGRKIYVRRSDLDDYLMSLRISRRS